MSAGAAASESLTAEGAAAPPASALGKAQAAWAGFREDCRSLATSPRDLFVSMAIYCGAAFTYNTMANTMTVFATAEYGFDDIETGKIYGWWGLMSTLWAMVLGPVIDVLGVRKTGLIGFAIYAVARFVIVFTNDRDIFKFVVIFISPFAEGLAGLSSSLYGLATKRYTSTANRNFGYAIQYAVMNFGGAVAGFIIDFVTGDSWNLFGTPVSGLRMALFLGFVTNSLCFAASATLRPLQVADDAEAELSDAAAAEQAESQAAAVRSAQPAERSPIVILQRVSKDRNFWRYVALMILLVLVKTEWHHNAATLPKFLIRLHGDRTWPCLSAVSGFSKCFDTSLLVQGCRMPRSHRSTGQCARCCPPSCSPSSRASAT